MNARTPRTGACTPADARTRLQQARLYLEAAELIQAEDLAEASTVATGNALLAAIAAADAICCSSAGVRSRGHVLHFVRSVKRNHGRGERSRYSFLSGEGPAPL